MARIFREIEEMRETELCFDGFTNETRFFRVSRETYRWLEEHGCLAAISLYDDENHIVSVSAEVDPDTGWNGWHWIQDEMDASGLNVSLYGL